MKAAKLLIILSLLLPFIKGTAFSTSPYDGGGAVNWADGHFNNPSDSYNYYGDKDRQTGTNCANFVSQCLRQGCYSQTLDAMKGTNGVDDRGCIPLCSDLDKFLKDHSRENSDQ